MRASLGTASTRASRPKALRALCCTLAAALTLAAAAPVFAWAEEAQSTTEGVAMYRLYNKYTGEHFYTSSIDERTSLLGKGWANEGIGWYAPESGEEVYRLYNKYAPGGDHHYTLDAAERDSLVAQGWTYEGVAWYSGGSVVLYRQYNSYAKTGTHNYTTSLGERDSLVSQGWKDEGTAWFGVGEGSPAGKTDIMGSSRLSASELADYYRYVVGEETYNSEFYATKGAPTIDDFCQILAEEAEVEGVRADVVFMQAMKETGWLRYGGAVTIDKCNFCGLGAVNSAPGNAATFEDVRQGLRAQVQHLKAYASTEPLVNECVDPRFSLVKRGVAPTLEQLNGKWAVPGNGYGESIASMIDSAVLLAQGN